MTIDDAVNMWKPALESIKTDVVEYHTWFAVYHMSSPPQLVWSVGVSASFEIANDAWFHLRHEP